MGLLEKTRAALKQAADPSKAAAMQAYMKSSMPYHGASAEAWRAAVRPVLAAHPIPNAKAWSSAVLELWSGAKFREERYAAVMLTGDQRAEAFQTVESLELYEQLITEGAWWDYVDELADHRVGALLRRHPVALKKAMRKWSVDEDHWKRRTSIICQLKFKTETDLKLLYDCIEPSLQAETKGGLEHPSCREFFIRKAIGWALRQYAWTDPAEVKRYVDAHRSRLSGLSIREALKNI